METRSPLLADSLFMHARWIAAGNFADLDVHPGHPRLYLFQVRRPAQERQAAFLNALLA